MKEMNVKSCALCPFVVDGSKYTFPECSLSERNPDDGLKKGVSSRVEAPIPDWCPLRKSPIKVMVEEVPSEETEQMERCKKCEWRAISHHVGNWCFLFNNFMPNCKRFKPNASQEA